MLLSGPNMLIFKDEFCCAQHRTEEKKTHPQYDPQ